MTQRRVVLHCVISGGRNKYLELSEYNQTSPHDAFKKSEAVFEIRFEESN